MTDKIKILGWVLDEWREILTCITVPVWWYKEVIQHKFALHSVLRRYNYVSGVSINNDSKGLFK